MKRGIFRPRGSVSRLVPNAGNALVIAANMLRTPPAPPVPAAPVNVGSPVISGSAIVGNVLTSTTGNWSGYPSPGYAFQWTKGGADIVGETTHEYTTVAGDVGALVGCTVTATNTEGSASADSNTIQVESGGGTALQFIEAISGSDSNSPMTVTKPTSGIAGDLLIVSAANLSSARTFTSTDGLLTLWKQAEGVTGNIAFFYRYLDASDSGRSSYSLTASGGGGGNGFDAEIWRNGVIDKAGASSLYASGPTAVPPINVAQAGSALVMVSNTLQLWDTIDPRIVPDDMNERLRSSTIRPCVSVRGRPAGAGEGSGYTAQGTNPVCSALYSVKPAP